MKLLLGLIFSITVMANDSVNKVQKEVNETIYEGKVVQVITTSKYKEMPNAVRVKVFTKKRTYNIDLGPEWFLNKESAMPKVGEDIKIWGYPEKEYNFLTLKFSIPQRKKSLSLRNKSGDPLWVEK